jgi:hypothetical protein
LNREALIFNSGLNISQLILLFCSLGIYEKLVTGTSEYRTSTAKYSGLQQRQQALNKLAKQQTAKEKNEYQSNLTCLRNMKRNI